MNYWFPLERVFLADDNLPQSIDMHRIVKVDWLIFSTIGKIIIKPKYEIVRRDVSATLQLPNARNVLTLSKATTQQTTKRCSLSFWTDVEIKARFVLRNACVN